MVAQTQRKPQTAIAPPKRATKTGSALAAAQLAAAEVKQKRKRTKQGCITCRVRGKKCDEVRNDDGTCNTCNRLRIHCLGFVDRRPEWLRTKENIKIWRKRVTDFLLSQGFVKGYAGCGLRSANVPERRLTLQEMRENLSTGDGPEEPDSPVTPAPPPPRLPTLHPDALHPDDPSSSRIYCGNGVTWSPHSHHYAHQLGIHHYSDSESNSTPPQQSTDLMYQDQQQNPISIANYSPLKVPSSSPYSSPSYTIYPGSLLSPLPSQRYVAPGLVSGPTAPTEASMALVPRFSSSSDSSSPPRNQSLVLPYPYSASYTMPMFISPTTNFQYEFYIDRYFTQVLGIQYRLADQKALRSIMSFLAQQNPAVKSSISLLSVLHIQSQAHAAAGSSSVVGLLPAPPRSAQKLYDKLYEQTRKLLQESTLFKQGRLDEGDAMACLHLISAFLFSGGRGTWWEFLDTAGDWVEATICEYGESPHLALLGLSERGRFIFRATMWMDVFSSVSLCRPPRFLRWYQQLFRPGVSLPEELGMDRIMGCPNDVILAFAETAQLEHDKQCETAACTTTITTTDGSTGNENVSCGRSVEADMMLQYMLRGRGMQIETYIPEVSGPVPLPSWERFVELKDTEDGSTDAEIMERDMRLKVAEVFKQAARVYLHSVVEGCDPQIPSIRRAVIASIHALTALRSSPLDRALIFPITITGCLVATQAEVDFCLSRLANVGNDANSFGNCLQARELIHEVWVKRIAVGIDANGVPVKSQPINWRIVMRELGEDPLLLV